MELIKSKIVIFIIRFKLWRKYKWYTLRYTHKYDYHITRQSKYNIFLLEADELREKLKIERLKLIKPYLDKNCSIYNNINFGTMTKKDWDNYFSKTKKKL